jgi:hypothetical protein
MGQENRQESDGEGDSLEKKRGVVVGETKGFEESIEGRSLIVGVRSGEMSASDKRSEKGEDEKSGGENERSGGRLSASRFVVGAMAWEIGPSRSAEKDGSALIWFRWVHKDLFGCSRRGVFQSLELLAGLKANSFSGRDADFFASAGIAADTGLSGFDAEDAELAKFDALAAAEGAFERLKDSFDGLLCFGAADVGLRNHSVYDVKLDHNRPPGNRGPMLEATAQVVKTCSVNYTSTF